MSGNQNSRLRCIAAVLVCVVMLLQQPLATLARAPFIPIPPVVKPPPHPLPPPAPTNLQVTATTTSSLTISWTASGGASGYYSTQNPGSKGKAAMGQANAKDLTTTSYKVSGLSANTTYYLAVSTVNLVGESPLSGLLTAKTSAPVVLPPVQPPPVVIPPLVLTPAVPSGLTVTEAEATTIKVTWEPVGKATGYYLSCIGRQLGRDQQRTGEYLTVNGFKVYAPVMKGGKLVSGQLDIPGLPLLPVTMQGNYLKLAAPVSCSAGEATVVVSDVNIDATTGKLAMPPRISLSLSIPGVSQSGVPVVQLTSAGLTPAGLVNAVNVELQVGEYSLSAPALSLNLAAADPSLSQTNGTMEMSLGSLQDPQLKVAAAQLKDNKGKAWTPLAASVSNKQARV